MRHRAVIEAIHAQRGLVTEALQLVAAFEFWHSAKRGHGRKRARWRELGRIEEVWALARTQRGDFCRGGIRQTGEAIAIILPHAAFEAELQLQEHFLVLFVRILAEIDFAEVNQMRGVAHSLGFEQAQAVDLRRRHRDFKNRLREGFAITHDLVSRDDLAVLRDRGGPGRRVLADHRLTPRIVGTHKCGFELRAGVLGLHRQSGETEGKDEGEKLHAAAIMRGFARTQGGMHGVCCAQGTHRAPRLPNHDHARLFSASADRPRSASHRAAGERGFHPHGQSRRVDSRLLRQSGHPHAAHRPPSHGGHALHACAEQQSGVLAHTRDVSHRAHPISAWRAFLHSACGDDGTAGLQHAAGVHQPRRGAA